MKSTLSARRGVGTSTDSPKSLNFEITVPRNIAFKKRVDPMRSAALHSLLSMAIGEAKEEDLSEISKRLAYAVRTRPNRKLPSAAALHSMLAVSIECASSDDFEAAADAILTAKTF